MSEMAPSNDSNARLLLWIRLLRSSRTIENELRERLRTEFGVTLPRFDVMAALHRRADGMLMSELSRFLMVSNGNVTGIIDRLVADEQVVRAQREGDRRTSIVKLTEKGRANFEQMAAAHEQWVDELFGGLSASDVSRMTTLLQTFTEQRSAR